MYAVLTLALIALLIAPAFAVPWLLDRRRAKAWRAAAARLGLDWRAEDPDFRSTHDGLQALSQGRLGHALGSATGERSGIRIWLADWRYLTGAGRSSSSETITVCILEDRGLSLPAVRCAPRRRFARALGREVDPGDPALAGTVLTGDSESAVRDLLGRGLRDWLLGPGKGLSMEARGQLILVASQKPFPAGRLEELSAAALDLRERLVGHSRPRG